MKAPLISIAIATLPGCAAMGPSYTQAPSPQGNQALIYIYRPDTYAFGGRDAYFYIDDINVVDLSRNGYTWFHVPAGKHQFKQKWPIDISLTKKLEASVNWEPGHTYYYKFVAYGGGVDSVLHTFTINWQLSEVDALQAMRDMQTTKLQQAFGASKLAQAGSTN